MATKVPSSMRAAAIDRFGGPAVLKLHALPVPPVDDDEVLIALHTSGVGGWDADMRGGWWPFSRPHFPVVLGTDGSGTVAAVGARVRRFKVGDKVYAYKWEIGKGGSYAEYVAVPAKGVAPIPKPLDLRHAGASPVTGLTALQGIDDALHLKKGQSIIIHGASGGVGTMAVQFAQLRGARVFATASGREGVALVRRLGADMAADGRSANISKAALQFAPAGVDCVLAFAGNKLAECLKALKRGGVLAYPHGIEPAPRKRKGLKVIAYDGVAGVREFERLNRAVEAARLKVPIAAAYPLAQAAKAHRRLAAGHLLGKVVLRIR
ncbi:MAG: quinone oxidoreductase family protein [Candidatus Angelobacter sp.]